MPTWVERVSLEPGASVQLEVPRELAEKEGPSKAGSDLHSLEIRGPLSKAKLDIEMGLPEGMRQRVVQVGAEKIDPALDVAIENGFSDFAKGDFADAEPFARKLANQS